MAEASVVPLSRSTRSLSHYIAKRTMTLGQANGIPLSAYTNEDNHRSSITQRFGACQTNAAGAVRSGKTGNNHGPGNRGNYERSPTTEGGVEALSGKRK